MTAQEPTQSSNNSPPPSFKTPLLAIWDDGSYFNDLIATFEQNQLFAKQLR